MRVSALQRLRCRVRVYNEGYVVVGGKNPTCSNSQLASSTSRLEGGHGHLLRNVPCTRLPSLICRFPIRAFYSSSSAATEDLEITETCRCDLDVVADTHNQNTGKENEKESTMVSKLLDAATVIEPDYSFADSLIAAAKKKSEGTEEQVGDRDPAHLFLEQLQAFLDGADLNALEAGLESSGLSCEQFVGRIAEFSKKKVTLQDLQSLVRAFESRGICTTSLVSILDKDVQVHEMQAGLQSLDDLMISRDELPSLIQRYPLVLCGDFQTKIALLDADLSAFASKVNIIRKAIHDHPHYVHAYTEGCATEVLEFLISHGFTMKRLNHTLQKVACLVLTDARKKMRTNVRFLEDLGLSNELIYKVIRRCPHVLFSNLKGNLVAKLEYFKTLGFDEAEFAVVISRYPTIFTASLDDRIKPIIAELQSHGLTDEGLRNIVLLRPFLFGFKSMQISKLVKTISKTSCIKDKKSASLVKHCSSVHADGQRRGVRSA